MKCLDCPRKCEIKQSGAGFCGKNPKFLRVSKVMRHCWEEPIISGKKGSGAIFFSYCNLKCKYCQNYKISHLGQGKDFNILGLVDILKKLDNAEVENINFVTPTHYTTQILEALNIYKPKVPIVWNTSGYEHNIERLKDFVDIFLFDIKYFDKKIAQSFSCAGDYFEVTKKALIEARKIIPNDVIENGIMKKGVIIRHLILPNCSEDSKKIFEEVKNILGTNIYVSLMSQYVPYYKAKDDSLLNRRLKPLEYKKVLMHLKKLGFNKGFIQEFCSAREEYTPNFCEESLFEL